MDDSGVRHAIALVTGQGTECPYCGRMYVDPTGEGMCPTCMSDEPSYTPLLEWERDLGKRADATVLVEFLLDMGVDPEEALMLANYGESALREEVLMLEVAQGRV